MTDFLSLTLSFSSNYIIHWFIFNHNQQTECFSGVGKYKFRVVSHSSTERRKWEKRWWYKSKVKVLRTHEWEQEWENSRLYLNICTLNVVFVQIFVSRGYTRLWVFRLFSSRSFFWYLFNVIWFFWPWFGQVPKLGLTMYVCVNNQRNHTHIDTLLAHSVL